MNDRDFVEFCDALVGTWVGRRDGDALRGERVKAVWERTLDGSFLREEWYTSGKEGELRHTATAHFRIASGAPAEFLVVYRGGAIATGESAFRSGVWSLTHRWLESGEEAAITLRLPGADTYRQEVTVPGEGGPPRLESSATLVRVQA